MDIQNSLQISNIGSSNNLASYVSSRYDSVGALDTTNQYTARYAIGRALSAEAVIITDKVAIRAYTRGISNAMSNLTTATDSTDAVEMVQESLSNIMNQSADAVQAQANQYNADVLGLLTY